MNHFKVSGHVTLLFSLLSFLQAKVFGSVPFFKICSHFVRLFHVSEKSNYSDYFNHAGLVMRAKSEKV